MSDDLPRTIWRKLLKQQRPILVAFPEYIRMQTAAELSGISRSVLYEYVREWEETEGKSGLRSFFRRGRSGNRGIRLIRYSEFVEWLPTILEDAAEARKRERAESEG